MVKLPKPKDFKDTRQLPSEGVIAEIGRLAIVSASIEDIMHQIFWKHAGVSAPVGATITGDARATRLGEDIVKIAKAANVDAAIVEDLSDIFTEHRALVQERNKFLHWIWSWNTETGEDRIDPPGYKSHLAGRYVTAQEVQKIGDDLVWIEARLAAHSLSEEELKESKKQFGLAGAFDAPTPWLEKLPLPKV